MTWDCFKPSRPRDLGIPHGSLVDGSLSDETKKGAGNEQLILRSQ